MKSGNLNFLEPSGPLQAFNGTALPYCMTNWFAHNYGIVDNNVIKNVVLQYVEVFCRSSKLVPFVKFTGRTSAFLL